MASSIRTGRVSAIDYKAGTYEVTYFDRGKSVTRQINAMSNGEYMMPEIGQIVSVNHNSNGAAAATTTGSIWNQSNRPAEGFKGLYRKEYSNKKGQAYDRYDANTGVFTQYVDKRTGRICNGEICDEAQGPIRLNAGGTVQIKSGRASISVTAKTGVGVTAEENVTVEAGGFVSIEAAAVTISINGAVIAVDEAGNVSITSGTKISMEAPEINISGASGEVAIGGITLTGHTHTGNLGNPTSGPD